jgi:hypothetical protein
MAVGHEATKRAFSRPTLHWHFVLATGAYLGELIRRHGQASWVAEAEGPALRVVFPDGKSLTARPFDKILSHRTSGRPGQLRAYVLFAAGRPVGVPAGASGAGSPGSP